MRCQSRLLPSPCERLFEVALDIERYPEFVPGYRAARIVRQATGRLEVEQTVGAGPLATIFHSYAVFESPRHIAIRSTDGLFHPLQVEWNFVPYHDGCRVEFGVDYTLNGPSATLLAPWLAWSVPRLLESFIRRARQLHGPGS